MSQDISKELIRKKFLNIYDDLTEVDKSLLNKEKLLNNIMGYAGKMKNVRKIDSVIDEYIFPILVKAKMKNL